MTRAHTIRKPNAQSGSPADEQTENVSGPSPEAVAVRAYELYLERGCLDGCDVDDWLRAEQQLRDVDRVG